MAGLSTKTHRATNPFLPEGGGFPRSPAKSKRGPIVQPSIAHQRVIPQLHGTRNFLLPSGFPDLIMHRLTNVLKCPDGTVNLSLSHPVSSHILRSVVGGICRPRLFLLSRDRNLPPPAVEISVFVDLPAVRRFGWIAVIFGRSVRFADSLFSLHAALPGV